MAKILIVEDEPKMAFLLEAELKDAGHRTTSVTDGMEAVRRVEMEHFDIVITDLRMEGMDGIEVLERVKGLDPQTEVVLITAYATAQTAVDAMKKGAYDYIIKPFDVEELKLLVKRIEEKQGLLYENALLQEKARREGLLVGGRSPAMRKVLELIDKVAPTDATVLVLGESGTGKELVARRIHHLSPRRDRPLVAVHCATFPENLLESELFGYERGAFTGATRRKVGHFEYADGGTIFLDEVGELPTSVQAKLLRFLQERQFTRIGGVEPVRVDVRVIAATNRDLEREVMEGRFREDLFYRLNVFPIELPPLRERREDIPLLVEHFLRQRNRPPDVVSPEAMEALLTYDWPGNVRELENVIE
ncbi:MAG TPA: sigma-54-dependent Fis family transcriptional regulator, partial [Candidatus Latescibacteria bacterium]|nr:sigma-54-dependent Fis family transcriptional regulator [Candidatus Latescibacterota bacterium]